MQPNKLIMPNNHRQAFSLTELVVLIFITCFLIFLAAAGYYVISTPHPSSCARNLKEVTTMTHLYAADNQGYAPPSGHARGMEETSYMGDISRNNEKNMTATSAPINIGALYEYFDITSDAALCPFQRDKEHRNSRGEAEHPNYINREWNEQYYRYGKNWQNLRSGWVRQLWSKDFYKYDKNWQNLRSGWMRQTWSKETGDPDELEGRGLDSKWAPDKTRLKFSVLPSGSLLLADYFDSNEHIIQTHKTFLNVGMISGNVYKIPYNKKEWPFNKLERPDLPTSCIKECWDYLEIKASATDRSNAR